MANFARVDGLAGEGGGGDEDELAGGKVFVCAHTFADLGRANRGARSVAFALHNQDIAEHILAD